MVSRFMRDDVLTRVQELQPVAADAGLSMAQLAVAWVLQNPNVASAIVGATRPEQVHDNVKAAGVKLDAEVMARDRRGPRAGGRARPGQDPEPGHPPVGPSPTGPGEVGRGALSRL